MDFTMSSEKHADFVKNFFFNEILQKGVRGVENLKKEEPKSVEAFFGDEQTAGENVNPYMLRMMTKYLIKGDSSILLDIEGGISTLVSLHLYQALYF